MDGNAFHIQQGNIIIFSLMLKGTAVEHGMYNDTVDVSRAFIIYYSYLESDASILPCSYALKTFTFPANS